MNTNAKLKPPKLNKEAIKSYKDTIKAIDKRVDHLDKEVKKIQAGNSRAIMTETYAESAGKHIVTVEKLASIDEKLAFNLLLALADASHCPDMDATAKMSGYGDSKEVFEKLDSALLPLIQQRASPAAAAGEAELPPVPHRFRWKDAEVGEFKTGWPNKQQRNQIYRQKLEWENVRRNKRRERRETTEDWVAVALSDLREERDYLDKYGVEWFLPESIAKLEQLSSSRTT